MDAVLDSLDSAPATVDAPPAATSTTSSTSASANLLQADDEMSSMLDEVLESLGDSTPQPLTRSVRSALASHGHGDGNETPSVLEELVSLVFQNLTMHELSDVLQGNFAPMERVQPVLADYIRRELLAYDTSTRRINQCASNIVDGVASSLTDQSLPSVRVPLSSSCSCALSVSRSRTYTYSQRLR